MKLLLPLIASLGFSLPAHGGSTNLTGSVKLDGSSTVYPVAEGLAEEFQIANPHVRVTVGLSGTGGGFKKFTSGETDIANASRKITTKEIQLAEKNKIAYLELPVAFDGISVVVNPGNKFVTELSLEQLKKLWEPGSKVTTWKDLDPSWPDSKIKLYGPGADSGTFDFFTEEVVGEARKSRADYVSSEDDNVIVRGVSADPNALGYFGYAYYIENKDKLKLLGVKEGNHTIFANDKTIEDGSYPLARPLLMYLNTASAKRPEVNAFVEFLHENAGKLAKEVGYVSLPSKTYKASLETYRKSIKTAKPSH